MGPKNSVQQAILSGGAKFDTHGANVTHGSADTFVVDFDDQNQASRFHMVKNARMMQEPKPGKSGPSGQPMEIAADQLDFLLENGNQLKTGDTVGKAMITILPSPPGSKPAKNPAIADRETGGQCHHRRYRRQVPCHFRRQQSHADAARRAQIRESCPPRPGQPDKVSTATIPGCHLRSRWRGREAGTDGRLPVSRSLRQTRHRRPISLRRRCDLHAGRLPCWC